MNTRMLIAGFVASLVSYPAALDAAASKTHLTQPLPSPVYNLALDDITQKKIFRHPLDAPSKYHYLLEEMKPEGVGAIGLSQKTAHALRQHLVQGIEYPIHIVPARMIDKDPATSFGETRLTNIQAFSGPNYARVIIDLSSASKYIATREGNNRLVIKIVETSVSPSLNQNILTLGESGLIKQVVIRESVARAASVDVDIEAASMSMYSVSRLSDPSRLIIELNSQVSQSRETFSANQVANANTSESSEDEKAVSINKAISPPIAVTNQSSAAVESKPAENIIKRIVIDAGHGGHDPGSISPNGVSEKEVVFDIAQRLKAFIKSRYPNVEVILTRESDYFMSLKQRADMANCWRADLFISIHANASESPGASGVETYYLNPNRVSAKPFQIANKEESRLAGESAVSRTSPQSANFFVSNPAEESEELAHHIQKALVQGLGSESPLTAKNRGVKHASFGVLLRAKMPSVLAEVSFLSNRRDAELLRSTQFRDNIAASLLSGLDAYLKNRLAETSQE